MGKEVIINADELERVMNTLEQLMNSIAQTSIPAFENLQELIFYSEGQAKEDVQYIFNPTSRQYQGTIVMEGMGADLYGKIQMLITYYNLINEYCLDALLCFKETDEKLAKLWDNLIQEVYQNG
ncbi:hypothetical protein [Listeria sp. ILCC792]|uniref:hypothetical protein n=1 Tax=Listeria sp. ILCC792 TaxID=1918331 RepID=UPI000B59828B|nr:hypothetical protein [Listeria sp. ILCC792]